MEERKTVFDYIGQILMIFGFTILILLVFSLLFGESAKGYSDLFSFGKEGIGVGTMIQFLLASIATVTLRMLFFYGYTVQKYAAPSAYCGYGVFRTDCDKYFCMDI